MDMGGPVAFLLFCRRIGRVAYNDRFFALRIFAAPQKISNPKETGNGRNDDNNNSYAL